MKIRSIITLNRFLLAILCFFIFFSWGVSSFCRERWAPKPKLVKIAGLEDVNSRKNSKHERIKQLESLQSPLRVLLYCGKDAVNIESVSVGSKNFCALEEVDPAQRLIVNGKISKDSKYRSSKRIRRDIVSASNNESALKFRDHIYRGCLVVEKNGSEVEVVNHISLEDYLRGVVPQELLCSYPEAVKAQAVVARTYALSRCGKRDSHWDLRSDTSSQVYGGVEAERVAADEAILATAGEYLFHNGRLATQTLYHSCCGGHTEGNDIIYGTDKIAYLEGVDCHDEEGQVYCANSAYSSWKASWSKEELGEILAEYLRRETVKIAGLEAMEVGPSGRIYRLKVYFAEGEPVVLEREEIRRALRFHNEKRDLVYLPSLKFNITKGQYPPIEGSDESENIEIEGSGWGHGIGMCQWGAIGMASRGASYMEILQHYYSGTIVARGR